MRKQTLVATMLGALALSIVAAVVTFRSGTAPAPRSTSAPESPPAPTSGTSESSPAPRGTQTLQGIVVTPKGAPVPGVEVSATRVIPGESLSTLPCHQSFPRLPLTHGSCRFARRGVPGHVEEDRGGARVLAQNTTRADGTFTLEGLPEGTVALWVLDSRGATMKAEVRTGTGEARLVLTQPHMLSGCIVDDASTPTPQAGARVTLFFKDHSRYFDTTADARGCFTLGPLPDGDKGLVVLQPGLLPLYLARVPSRFKEDLVLQVPRRVVGQVLLQGQPAAGAEVTEPETGARVRTDETGHFVLPDLAPATYSLVANFPGHRGLAQVHLLEEQSRAEVMIPLDALLQFSGSTKDERGQPVAGARVVVRFDGARENEETVSDAEGRFLLQTLASDECSFQVEADGHLDLYESRALRASAPPLDFVLKTATLVRGIVVDEQGHPLPRVGITLQPVAEAAATNAGGDDAEESPSDARRVVGGSDADGRFHIKLEAPGRYDLQAQAPDHLELNRTVDAPDTTLRLVLSKGARVQGRVVDPRGDPVPDADVVLRNAENETSSVLLTSSDAEGRFAIQGVAPGQYILRARVPRVVGAEASVRIAVQGTERVEQDVSLEPGHPVSGVVVDETGKPLANAAILGSSVVKDGHVVGADAPMTESDEQGRFTVRAFPQGPVYLGVMQEGYALIGNWPSGRRGSAIVETTAGATDLRLVVRSEGGVRGRVRAEDGTPIVRFRLNDVPQRNLAGEFFLPTENPNLRSIWLSLSAPGLASVLQEVRLERGRDVNLGDVVLRRLGSKGGRVVDAETSEPITDVPVRAILPNTEVNEVLPLRVLPTSAWLTVAEDGTFDLPQSNDYTLKVDHPGYMATSRRVRAGETQVELRLRRTGEAKDTDDEPAPPDEP
ncbi:carboxypeptidase regulatory-like domain-containing protein [Myxococcus stipitatus]|uniref:carboxypeptidase regulatory-like domain-containing protein n=1 Tax=Myxococcus stipitatus TaxID=83455 RepID=UPI001F4269E2|nr:carboxypeptidase regulatory-like domain-containing protein [Myxococcus stipitatus]MCE9673241.1 carboxypeptidase regulatory-like domain-containing protein [Myxococcus stipitatus]